MIETTVRVVRIDGSQAWFAPEGAAHCAACASATLCGGGEAGGRRLGRLALDDLPATAGLRIGDRIVVGVDNGGLLRALLLACMLPLAAALLAGIAAELLFAAQGYTVAATAAGLGAGVLAAWRLGRRPAAQRAIASHYLRPAACAA